MTFPQIIEIDKKQAASCQIDTAIALFFENKGNTVSVLSLAYSAWGIVKNLLTDQHASVRQAFADDYSNLYQKPWEKLDELWNFIKHAERDANSVFQFPARYEEIVLFSVVHDFGQVFDDWSVCRETYYYWFLATRHHDYSEDDKKELQNLLIKAQKRFPCIAQRDITAQKTMGYQSLQALIGG